MCKCETRKRQAEMLHAEHHQGTFVPTLDSCPEHTLEEYAALVEEILARPPAAPQFRKTDEFHLYTSSGTNRIFVRHNPCGHRSEPVNNLYEAEGFRQSHVCPEENECPAT